MREAMMPHRLIAEVCPKFSISVSDAGRVLPLAARARPTALPANR